MGRFAYNVSTVLPEGVSRAYEWHDTISALRVKGGKARDCSFALATFAAALQW